MQSAVTACPLGLGNLIDLILTWLSAGAACKAFVWLQKKDKASNFRCLNSARSDPAQNCPFFPVPFALSSNSTMDRPFQFQSPIFGCKHSQVFLIKFNFSSSFWDFEKGGAGLSTNRHPHQRGGFGCNDLVGSCYLAAGAVAPLGRSSAWRLHRRTKTANVKCNIAVPHYIVWFTLIYIHTKSYVCIYNISIIYIYNIYYI